MEDEDGEESGDEDATDDDLLPGAALQEEETSLLRTARALRASLTDTAKALPEFRWGEGKEEKLVEIIANAKTLQKPRDMVGEVAAKKPDYLRKRDTPLVKLQAGIWNMVKLGVGSLGHVCEGNSSLAALEVLTLKACEMFKKINDVRKVEVLGISKTVIEAESDENAQKQLKTIQQQIEAGKELRTLQRSGQSAFEYIPRRAASVPPATTPGSGGYGGKRYRRKGKGQGNGGGGKPLFPRGPRNTDRSPNSGSGGKK
jgi:hypothetical protein